MSEPSIAETLAEHDIAGAKVDDEDGRVTAITFTCTCGEQWISGSDGSSYDRHAAAVLEAREARLLAEAWDEGLRFGQLHWATNYAGAYQNGSPLLQAPNPYRPTEGDDR